MSYFAMYRALSGAYTAPRTTTFALDGSGGVEEVVDQHEGLEVQDKSTSGADLLACFR